MRDQQRNMKWMMFILGLMFSVAMVIVKFCWDMTKIMIKVTCLSTIWVFKYTKLKLKKREVQA